MGVGEGVGDGVGDGVGAGAGVGVGVGVAARVGDGVGVTAVGEAAGAPSPPQAARTTSSATVTMPSLDI